MVDVPATPAAAAGSTRYGYASLCVLVAVNLVPIAGVAQFGWKVADLVFLYWVENLAIGILNVARILLARPDLAPDYAPRILPTPGQVLGFKIAIAAFFAFHYSIFCFAHGELLATFFGGHSGGSSAGLGGFIRGMLREPMMVATVALIAASHVFSLAYNYLGRGEYTRVDLQKLMVRPYARILGLHTYIIAGGIVLIATGSPTAAIVVFAAVKIFVDAAMHVRERALHS